MIHFKPSSIADIERLSQVESRYATVTGLAHRTGFDKGQIPTGRVTISGYNAWVGETLDREKVLAPPIERAKEFIGPDYKPTVTSEIFGVNRSSHGVLHERSVQGAPARVMQPGDVAHLPDPRDSFGHTAHVRLTRVRGAA